MIVATILLYLWQKCPRNDYNKFVDVVKYFQGIVCFCFSVEDQVTKVYCNVLQVF